MTEHATEPKRNIGDEIRYSSGGKVHSGTITELHTHGHVKVDTSPFMVIPPGWILDEPGHEG